jgi:hypothetical protein
MKGDKIMTKLALHYARYALAVLTTVGFRISFN